MTHQGPAREDWCSQDDLNQDAIAAFILSRDERSAIQRDGLTAGSGSLSDFPSRCQLLGRE